MSPDVVVVGAGPAGGAAALGLARAGASVLVLDRRPFPRWKVCGGCVGPAAGALLTELGLGGAVDAAGARPLEALELRAGPAVARLGLDGSRALSRATLDGVVLDAAAAAGAVVRCDVRVAALRGAGDEVEVELRADGASESLRTRAVVDATGLGALALDGRRADESVAVGSRVGLGAVFEGSARDGPATELAGGTLRMAVGRDGYVGLVVVEDGSLNVAAAVDADALAASGPGAVVSGILEEAGCGLPDGSPSLGWRGTPPLTRRTQRAAKGRVFRVGDAAGYVEPFTGEGIGWALGAGVSVAAFVLEAVAGDVDEAARGWAAHHRAAARRRQRLCRLLAAGLRRPRLVRAAARTLSLAPGLAGPMVGLTANVPGSTLAAARRGALEPSPYR